MATHWWLAWCSQHISWHKGCWSIQGNRGSFPWSWSVALTVASYSRCTGNTRDARVSPDRSPLLLWWPGDVKNDKNEPGLFSLPCLFPYMWWEVTLKGVTTTLPSYKRSTGMHIVSQNRERRSSLSPLGWMTWFLSAAGTGGTGSRSHASCSPCIPFCGHLVQGTGATYAIQYVLRWFLSPTYRELTFSSFFSCV